MGSAGTGLVNFNPAGVNAAFFVGSPFPTQGKAIFVKPSTGSDGNRGDTPKRAVKTLAKALSLATADKNDTVFMFSEDNSASGTTDYQSELLDWNKDGVHLIGVNSGSAMGQRSRVAMISTFTDATGLFKLSASNCMIANIHFFAGVADTNPTGCVEITGSRNLIQNCHIYGIGNNSMDIAGASSLKINGAEECTIKDCVIGGNTVLAGSAANSEILFDGSSKNIIFQNCVITRKIEHTTNHPLVKVADATGIDDFVLFDNCKFISLSVNYAVAQSGVFKLAADLTAGLFLVHNCIAVNDNASGNGKWDVDDYDKIAILAPATPAADTAGLIRVV